MSDRGVLLTLDQEQSLVNIRRFMWTCGAVPALTFVGTRGASLISGASKQAYCIGTMGYTRGRATYTLAKSLNSGPVINEFGATAAELFASPGPVLFSQVESQGGRLASSMSARGNFVYEYASNKSPSNLRAWNLFKSGRQSGARDLSIAEHSKIDALAEKFYDSIRKSSIDTDLIAKNTGIPAHRVQRIKIISLIINMNFHMALKNLLLTL